jgi:hypothetical protein
MGKTYRKNDLDQEFGCFEEYRRKSSYGPRFGLDLLDDDYFEQWDYQHDKKRWDQRRRDGKSGNYNYVSGGNQLFRQMTNKLVRQGARQAIHRGIRSGDWDDLIFPTDWDGKQFIWNVW